MNLEQLRQEIDKADAEILKAFCRRMDAVGEVAKTKIAKGIPVLDASREVSLLAGIEENTPDKYALYSRALFTEMMRISRLYQQEIMDGVKE